MEERKLTPEESMDLITSMIKNTTKHFIKGEGNMLLFWGYLCVAVIILKEICSYLKFVKGIDISFIPYNILWLIPIIGIPYTLYVKRHNSQTRKVLTYTDRISGMLWSYVLWLALAAFLIGLFFFISGFPAWYVMELYAFFVIGMAVSMQGIIIGEKSMLYGGAFSVICGGIIVIGRTYQITPIVMVSSLLLMVSFIVMMIIPGHILNHKTDKEL